MCVCLVNIFAAHWDAFNKGSAFTHTHTHTLHVTFKGFVIIYFSVSVHSCMLNGQGSWWSCVLVSVFIVFLLFHDGPAAGRRSSVLPGRVCVRTTGVDNTTKCSCGRGSRKWTHFYERSRMSTQMHPNMLHTFKSFSPFLNCSKCQICLKFTASNSTSSQNRHKYLTAINRTRTEKRKPANVSFFKLKVIMLMILSDSQWKVLICYCLKEHT